MIMKAFWESGRQWFFGIHLFSSYGMALWFDSWQFIQTSAHTLSGLRVFTSLSEFFPPPPILSGCTKLGVQLALASNSLHPKVVCWTWAGSREQEPLMADLQLFSWIVLRWSELGSLFSLTSISAPLFLTDVWISLVSCLMTYMEVGKSLQDTTVLCSLFLKTPNLR